MTTSIHGAPNCGEAALKQGHPKSCRDFYFHETAESRSARLMPPVAAPFLLRPKLGNGELSRPSDAGVGKPLLPVGGGTFLSPSSSTFHGKFSGCDKRSGGFQPPTAGPATFSRRPSGRRKVSCPTATGMSPLDCGRSLFGGLRRSGAGEEPFVNPPRTSGS